MDGSCHVSVKQNTEQSLKSRLDWMRKKSSSALCLSERTLERNTQRRGGLMLWRQNLTSVPVRLPHLCVCQCECEVSHCGSADSSFGSHKSLGRYSQFIVLKMRRRSSRSYLYTQSTCTNSRDEINTQTSKQLSTELPYTGTILPFRRGSAHRSPSSQSTALIPNFEMPNYMVQPIKTVLFVDFLPKRSLFLS